MDKDAVNSGVDDTTFAKETLQCEIGNKLKQARKEKNFTAEFITKELKFSQKFLTALESGNWQVLPGEVYAIGFLKQYAALLEIDVTSSIQRIKSKTFELKIPVVYHDVPIFPQRKFAIAAALIFSLLLITINIFGTSEETQGRVSETYIEPSNTSAVNTTIQTEQNLKNEYVNPAPIIVTETAIEKPIRKTFSFYAATNDVWLQVSELDENSNPRLLREVLLNKGESFSIIGTPEKLVLTAGNARALEILEGNKVLFAAGTLGKENKVLKLFPINP